MLYIEIRDGKAVAAHTHSEVYFEPPLSDEECVARRELGMRCETRNDWRTLNAAQQRAIELTEATGELYIATDRPGSYPRFDVIRAPQVGDPVSYAFNGDCYPCGHITGVSPTLKVVRTSSGRSFTRQRDTGSWVSQGTWALVQGHHEERNPHL